MTVEESSWNKWKVMICTTLRSEMIIGVSSGPRILSYRHTGHENLLYQDTTNFKVGDWCIYGGHRFTTAPENEESYFPDNDSCRVEVTDAALLITAPERSSGLQLSLLIRETEDGEGFDITHILNNHGESDWNGALWAVTCVPRSAQVMAGCSTSRIHFWPGTDPVNWQPQEQQMTIKPGDFRGKAGWHQVPVSLKASQSGGTLLITHNEISAPEECVDEGSNVEIFVCPDFIELETLSKKLIIPSRQSQHHRQQWKIFPPHTNL
jgi:hypothetical protein